MTERAHYTMKKYFIILLITICLSVAGCSSRNTSNSTNDSEIIESDVKADNVPNVISNAGITLDNRDTEVELQENYYPEIPAFYQSDYPNIPFGNSTIQKGGNLLTCLSMIESYITYKTITPDLFIEVHDKLCSAGSDTLTEDSIYDFAESLNKNVTKEKFEIENISSYLLKQHAILLLHIPHNSMYGMSSSYLIITGMNENGVEVRDPVRTNVDSFGHSNYDNPTYSIYDLCTAASTDSFVYIIYQED